MELQEFKSQVNAAEERIRAYVQVEIGYLQDTLAYQGVTFTGLQIYSQEFTMLGKEPELQITSVDINFSL